MAFENYGDWTDRIAKGELPHTKPQRPQGVERNIVVTLRDWMNDKQYLHDLISSDRRYPTVNANGPLYGSPEYSSDMHPDPRPGQERRRRRSRRRCAIRRCRSTSGPAMPRRSTPLQPSPYWGNERSGRRASTITTRCSDATAGCGSRRRCAAPTTRRSARRARITRRRRRSRWIAPSATSRCSIPRRRSTRSSTPASRTHHPQFGYDANDTLWTSGGGPVVGWLNTKMFDQTGDAAKSQGWTALVLDTNGNGKRDAYAEPGRAGGPGQGHAHQLAVLRRDAEPGGRLDLGRDAGRSRRGRAPRAGIESAGDGARRGLQRADARLWRARRRHRQPGRGLGVARQRPHRQLRSPQVQGAAQRAKGHRRPLPRGLVVPPVSRARASRASARTAPSRATTRGSISTTRSGSATTCRCPPAI